MLAYCPTDCLIFRDQLIEKNVHRLRAFVMRMRLPPPDAEDVLQQTLFRALTKFEQFRGDSRFFTWLCSIALNEARQAMRNQRSHLVIPLDNELLDRVLPSPESDTSFDLCRRAQQQVNVRQAVERLKPEFRTVVELPVFQGLSLKDTARRLRLSVPAAKSRFFRARQQLLRVVPAA